MAPKGKAQAMIKTILAHVERLMPRYGQVVWSGYTIKLFATEHDVFRVLPIIPYYWDSDIELDLVVWRPKRGLGSDAPQLQYTWALYDSDDHLIKHGQDVYVFNDYKLPFISRKHRAIKLGYLKPHQFYKLNIMLTDNYGTNSSSLTIASFAIKDRDEVFTQLLIALVVIIMGIIIGFVAKGCS